ncbi:MAG: SCO family protein, partial [Vulcanimicrobiaceae bacterium]
MRQSSARAGAVLGAFLLFGFIILGAQPVAADDAVRGVVLAVQRSTDRIVVRPDDGATVSVRAEPASVVATLAVGARVSGRLDRSTTPPTLRELRLVGTAPVVDPTHVDQAFVSAQQLIHSVKLLAVGDRLPATRFVDQRGRSFSFDRLRGQGVVIGFIYTRCKDINECPLVTAHFHVLQEQFKNQPVHLVELTIDPAHDTPAVLAAYGNAYGEDPRRWTFLTGDPNTVLRFGARLGVTAIPDPRVGLIHT